VALVEPGTGSGELTRDVAFALAERAPDTFAELGLMPVDASQAALRRARETLDEAGIVLDDVDLRTDPPDRVEGAIVANELLDAIPTHLAQHTEQGLAEIALTRGDPAMAPTLIEPSKPVLDHARVFDDAFEAGLRFEVPLNALDWYRQAARSLDEGVIVTIDYGATRRELLEAYPKATIHAYRDGHRVEEFWYDPGRMDITYRVPFDEVQAVGEAEGLTTIAYGPQGKILEEAGIRDIAREAGADATLAAKKLLDPDGAGGTFHILVQGRGIDSDRFPDLYNDAP